MSVPLPQRVPENVPGDFYVEADCCTSCCLVHGEAPDLLNDPRQPFRECFFRRQPQTPDEVSRAIDALCVSEVWALRYGGRGESIIARLRARGVPELCDHAPEGIAYLARRAATPSTVARPASSCPRSLWHRVLGRFRRKSE